MHWILDRPRQNFSPKKGHFKAQFRARAPTAGPKVSSVDTFTHPLRAALIALLAFVHLCTAAQQDATAMPADQLLKLVAQTVEQASQQAVQAMPGTRVETEVGQLDPRLRLAPCAVMQPYLPAGTRVWGEIRIGLRCVEGPVRWNVYVPARVKIFAPALVMIQPQPAGQVLTAQDVKLEETELSAEPGAHLTDATMINGRTLLVALRAGQALRQTHLRQKQWFAAGDTVQLVAKGSGFAISSEGIALAPGIDGQAVRIKIDNGRVIQGQATGLRRVDVAL